MKNVKNPQNKIKQKVLSISLCFALIIAVSIFSDGINSAIASDITPLDATDESQWNISPSSWADIIDAGTNTANLTMGHGAYLSRYGSDWGSDSVTPNTKIFDTSQNPCLSFSVMKDPVHDTKQTTADSKDSYGKSFGNTTTAGFDNDANLGGKGKSRAEVMDSYAFDSGNGRIKFLPEYAMNKMKSSPAAVNGAISSRYSDTTSWSTRTSHFSSDMNNKLVTTHMLFGRDGNVYGVPRGNECVTIKGMSRIESMRANTSSLFRQDAMSKISARNFLEKWGEFALTDAAYGARASFIYDYYSNDEAKSQDVAAGADIQIGKLKAGTQNEWSSSTSSFRMNGDLRVIGLGGYSAPALNWDPTATGALSIAQNPTIMKNWEDMTSTSPTTTLALIGAPGRASVDQIDKMGKYVWELIDPKLLAPEQYKYPSANECHKQFDDNIDRLDFCISRAEQVMSYADYLHITYRTILQERGESVQERVPEGPYVKDVYVGTAYRTPSYYGGEACGNYWNECVSKAKNALDNEMKSQCDAIPQPVAHCIKLNLNDSMNVAFGVHPYVDPHGGPYTVQGPPIFIGYTLTNNISEALVSFKIIEGVKRRPDANGRSDTTTPDPFGGNCNYLDKDYLSHIQYSNTEPKWSNRFNDRGYVAERELRSKLGASEDGQMPENYKWCKTGNTNGGNINDTEVDIQTSNEGKALYLGDEMRYNSNYPSVIDSNGNYHNVPITAIGLEIVGVNLFPNVVKPVQLPGNNHSVDEYIPNSRFLSTGKLDPNRFDLWLKIPQNLTEGDKSGWARETHFWIGH